MDTVKERLSHSKIDNGPEQVEYYFVSEWNSVSHCGCAHRQMGIVAHPGT